MSEAKCDLCGEPMPPGEGVFKFHGYSGNCPKPPLPRTSPARIDAAAKECASEEHQLRYQLTAALSEEQNRTTLLADALGRVLTKIGVVNNVPMTGPDLLCAAETFLAAGAGE